MAVVVVLAAGAAGRDRDRCGTLHAGNVDDCLRLNQIQQSELLGIRQLELDVFHDPDGGHYLRPAGRRLVGGPEELEDPPLRRSGFKVLHFQDLDFETTCPTLPGFLEKVRD